MEILCGLCGIPGAGRGPVKKIHRRTIWFCGGPCLYHRSAAVLELRGIEFIQPRSQRTRVFLIYNMAGLRNQL